MIEDRKIASAEIVREGREENDNQGYHGRRQHSLTRVGRYYFHHHHHPHLHYFSVAT